MKMKRFLFLSRSHQCRCFVLYCFWKEGNEHHLILDLNLNFYSAVHAAAAVTSNNVVLVLHITRLVGDVGFACRVGSRLKYKSEKTEYYGCLHTAGGKVGVLCCCELI
jgi:hypothetical protein